ncbi:hypothetical protein D9M68_485010 [compost metagenome]
MRQLQHIAHRPVERAQARGRPPARPQVGGLRSRAAADRAGGAAEALQVDAGVAQFDVDLVVLAVVLPVQHQRAAQAVGVQAAAIEEVDLPVGDLLHRELADRQVARDIAQRKIEDRPDHQFLAGGDREIPADADGAGERVPPGRDGARFGAVAGNKGGIVAAVRDRAFEVEGERLADGEAAAELRHDDAGIVGAGVIDRQRAGSQVGHHGIRHQRQHRVGVPLHVGTGQLQPVAGLGVRGPCGQQAERRRRGAPAGSAAPAGAKSVSRQAYGHGYFPLHTAHAARREAAAVRRILATWAGVRTVRKSFQIGLPRL